MTVQIEQLPASVKLSRLPWRGSGTPFLRIAADATAMQRTLLIACAVPEQSRHVVRLSPEGYPAGLNGCVVTVKPASELTLRAALALDHRDAPEASPQPIGSRESKHVVYDEEENPTASTRSEATEVELPFIFSVVGFAPGTDPEALMRFAGPLTIGASDRVQLKGSGSFGYVLRPPFGYHVVTPRMPFGLAVTEAFENVTVGAGGTGSEVLVDFGSPREGWAPSIRTGPITPGWAGVFDARVRVIGAGTEWSVVPISPERLGAAMHLSLGVQPAAQSGDPIETEIEIERR